MVEPARVCASSCVVEGKLTVIYARVIYWLGALCDSRGLRSPTVCYPLTASTLELFLAVTLVCCHPTLPCGDKAQRQRRPIKGALPVFVPPIEYYGDMARCPDPEQSAITWISRCRAVAGGPKPGATQSWTAVNHYNRFVDTRRLGLLGIRAPGTGTHAVCAPGSMGAATAGAGARASTFPLPSPL